MKKNLTAFGVVLALILSVVAITRHSVAPISNPMQKNFGSVAGPDIPSPYISWGNVKQWNFNQQAVTASTTCQILSPAATTTSVFVTANFSSIASSTQVEIGYNYVATSTFGMNGVQYTGETGIRQFSTSTLLSPTISLSTGGGIATSTLNGVTIPPYTYINVKLAGGSSHTPNSVVGNCTAGFREVQYLNN